MIADSVGPQRRATAIGSWQTIAGSAAVLGPGLGGFVWTHYAFWWLLLIGGGLYLVVAALRQIWLEERWQHPDHPETHSRLGLMDGLRSIQGNSLLMLVVLVGVANAVFSTMSSFMVPIFSQRTLDLGPTTIGLMFSILALAYLVAAIPGGKLAERTGPLPVVVASGLLSVVPEAAFLVAAGPGAALGTFGLWVGMDAFGGPAFSAWSLNLSRADQRGSVQGTLYGLAGFATLPIPLVAALLFSVQARLPFELDIFATVVLFGILWAYGRQKPANPAGA
jgi:MFS family permease